MGISCFWSSNPSYDTATRIRDCWQKAVASKYHLIDSIFPHFNHALSDILHCQSIAHFVSGRRYEVFYSSPDLIKGIFELDKAFEELDFYLKDFQSHPKCRFICQWSKDGYNNIDYGDTY